MTELLKTKFYIHHREDRDGRRVRVIFSDPGPFPTYKAAYRFMETVERQPDGRLLASLKPEFKNCLVDRGAYLMRSMSATVVFEPFHKEPLTGVVD